MEMIYIIGNVSQLTLGPGGDCLEPWKPQPSLDGE
jgi:hypothetical protein